MEIPVECESSFEPEGRSEQARRLRVAARTVVRSRQPILVVGELGVGKIRFARFLHAIGERPNSPLRRVTCAEEGISLTAILNDVAGGGTIVLERVEEAAPSFQRSLARTLGGSAVERSVLRIVATTRRDLAVEVLEGRFFADLYFRLRVQTVEVAPLRERREDVPVIARTILEEAARGRGGDPPELTSEALELACEYRWPGNIRQLRNELFRCALRSQHTISRATLAEGLDARIPPQTLREASTLISLRSRIGAYERQVIEEVLRSTRGNRERTASLLGITRRTLQRKLAAARRAGTPLRESIGDRPLTSPGTVAADANPPAANGTAQRE